MNIKFEILLFNSTCNFCSLQETSSHSQISDRNCLPLLRWRIVIPMCWLSSPAKRRRYLNGFLAPSGNYVQVIGKTYLKWLVRHLLWIWMHVHIYYTWALYRCRNLCLHGKVWLKSGALKCITLVGTRERGRSVNFSKPENIYGKQFMFGWFGEYYGIFSLG